MRRTMLFPDRCWGLAKVGVEDEMRIRRGVVAAVSAMFVMSQAVLAVPTAAIDGDDAAFRPPPNDDFVAAAPLELGGEVSGTTRDATAEPDDPGLSCVYDGAAPLVWYRMVSPSDGVVTVALDGRRSIALFRGSTLSTLTEGACSWVGRAQATVAGGEVVMVAVPDISGTSDAGFRLTATIRALDPPPNDDLEDAAPLVAGDVIVETTDASTEPGEPRGSCSETTDGTLWYSVTPEETTRLAVSWRHHATLFEGSTFGALREVACGYGQVVHTLSPGTTYRLALDGDPYGDAASTLSVDLDTPPANDRVGDAETLTAANPVSGTTSLAGYDEGEPRPRCMNETDASVWYRYTATEDGIAVVDAEADTGWWQPVVAIYSGSLGEAITCDRGWEEPRAAVTAGREYLIQVASPSWASRSRRFTVELRTEAPSVRDDFASAPSIAFPTEGEGDVVPYGRTSRQEGEPLTCLGETGTSWYRFDAPADLDGKGYVQGWWARAAVFEAGPSGSLSDLREIGCGVRPGFPVSPGRSYYVALGGAWGGRPLTLDHVAAPANDDLDDAVPMPLPAAGEVTGEVVDATREYGEVVCGHDESVWYRYTAVADGRATFSVHSDVNHAVGVSLGEDVSALTPLRCGNLPLHEAETVTVPVAAGRTYAVRVARTDNATAGTYRLVTAFTPAERPANDDFGDGAPTLAPGSARQGSVDGATVEQGEPDHDCPVIDLDLTVPTASLGGHVDDPAHLTVTGGRGPGSVWYRFDAADSGVVRLRLGGDDELGFTVYKGSTLHDLEPVTCRDRRLPGRDEVADLAVTAGTYWVAIDDRDASRGEPATGQGFELLLETIDAPPANDAITSAEPVGFHGAADAFHGAVSGDTARSTVEPGEPRHQCPLLPARAYSHSVWYDLGTADSDGRLVAHLAAEADQTLALYDASNPADLERVSCVDVPLLDEETNAVNLRAGVPYLLAVLSDSDHTSRFDLDLAFAPREGPANDDFGDARPIVPGDLIVASTVGATVERDEPATCGAGPSVWHTFEAPADGQLRIEMQASAAHRISAYRGERVDALTPVFCNTDGDDPTVGVVIGGGGITLDVEGEVPPVEGVYVVPVTAGTIYSLAIKAFDVGDAGVEGAATFTPHFFPYPANDEAGDGAEILDASPGGAPAQGDLRAGTPGDVVGCEPARAADLWYRYRAPSDGVLELTLDTGPQLFDDRIDLEAYSGPNTSVFRDEGCHFQEYVVDEVVPRRTLPLVGGRTYWFRVVADIIESEAPFTLGARFAAAPPDDGLRSGAPTDLTSSAPAAAWTGTLAGATSEWGEDPWCGGEASTWRAFRVEAPGVVQVTLAAPEGMSLSLWRSPTATPRFAALDQLSCWAAGASVHIGDLGVETSTAGPSSTAVVTVDPASVYFVSVDGRRSISGGNYAVDVAWAPAPLAPEASIDDVTIAEPVAPGDAVARFTVSLSRPTLEPMTIAYEVEGVTASVGADVGASSGSVEFPAGASSAVIEVPILSDGVDEEDEVFAVHLRPTGGVVVRDGTGIGTITDSDETPAVTVSDVAVSEGAGVASFEVSIDRPSSRPISLSWRTRDGTAISKHDYTAGNGAVTLPPGETTVWVQVPVTDDRRAERDEAFDLVVSEAVHATLADGVGVATIADDDGRRSR